MDNPLKRVAMQFAVEGEFVSAERYGAGHINDTFLLVTERGGQAHRYILQRINSRLFTDVEKLMHNIQLVTQFNRKRVLARGGDPAREGLTLIPTREGRAFFAEGEEYWRMYLFIEGAVTYQVVQKPNDFYEAAVAFGNFANLLAEFDASLLYEILPDFHNTEVRYGNFERALQEDKCGRAASVKAEIDFVKSRKAYAGILVEKLRSGEIPLRVTHNDTKLNNVMIDEKTGKAIAVIDLDTVMPGSLCYDFGDSIRFGCNPVAEDERDLAKVVFQVPLFEQFARGYLSAVGNGITQAERDNLVMGSILMTYECGMRFLTDYLQGDTYFHTVREGQNLDRARTQFKLVAEMERLRPRLEEIVRQY